MNWKPISEVEGLQNAIESLMVGSARWSEQTPRHKQDRVVLRDGDCRLIVNWIERMMSERDSGFALAEQFESQISEACEITTPSDGAGAFLKCPKCNDDCMGTDITDEAIDCHYCDTEGRITAQAFVDQHDRMQQLVGDAMVQEFEMKSLKKVESSLAEALEKIIEMNRQHAQDQYGDANKAESWACIIVARAALAMRQAGGKEGGGE